MADLLPLPDDDGIQWTKAISRNGVPFEVGIKPTEQSIEEKSGDESEAAIASFYPVNVYWPVGDTTWKGVSGEISAKQITRYRLYDNGVSIYSYRLDVSINRLGVVQFWDESEDDYQIDIIIRGDHYVRYNSDKPTIRFVQ